MASSDDYATFVRRLLSQREQFFEDVVEDRALRRTLCWPSGP